MELCAEMKKLRKQLTERNIEWKDVSIICPESLIETMINEFGQPRQYCDTTIFRTHFSYKGKHYSVINGFGTYGGFEPIENKNYGLLECMYADNVPIGWLTADDIIKIIEEN